MGSPWLVTRISPSKPAVTRDHDASTAPDPAGSPEVAVACRPHNIDAEESVLGAMLLSREAIGIVSEMGLNPADFYRPANRHIFDAIRALYSSAAPADTVTVADELRRAGLLDEVGGPAALHELQNATPAISSAGPLREDRPGDGAPPPADLRRGRHRRTRRTASPTT